MHTKASTGKIRQTYGFIRGAPQSVRRANNVLAAQGGSGGLVLDAEPLRTSLHRQKPRQLQCPTDRSNVQIDVCSVLQKVSDLMVFTITISSIAAKETP